MKGDFLVQYRKYSMEDWKDIPEYKNVECTPQTLDGSIPEAKVVINNRNGRYSTRFTRSDEVRVFIFGVLRFHGKVIRVEKTPMDSSIVLTLHHIAYAKLREKICMDSYRHFGYSGWKWGAVSQNPGENPQGIRPDQAVRAAIGTRFYCQSFFEQSSIIGAGYVDIAIEANQLVLTKDSIGNIEQYKATGHCETQVLISSLINYSDMNEVRDVTIIASGSQPAGTSIQIEISRDNGLTFVPKSPSYVGNLWTATVTEGEFSASTVRNRVVVKFVLNSDGTRVFSPKIGSFLLEAETVDDDGLGDTGLSEGTIDLYEDAELDDDTFGADFSRQTRLEVFEGAIKASVSAVGEGYPTWFGYITLDGVVHYRDPATFGTDRTNEVTFSKDTGTLTDIKANYEGGIVNNLVYIGQGVPPFGEITVTAGGPTPYDFMKVQDSIDLYGEIQGTIQEKGIPSQAYAVKRARILSKHLPYPVLVIECTPTPEFRERAEVGDIIRVADIRQDINTTARLLSKTFSFDSEGSYNITWMVSNSKFSLKGLLTKLSRGQQDQNLIGQGSTAPPSVSFQDNVDFTHPVEMSFWLPRDTKITAVRAYVKSGKFRSFETSAAAATSVTKRNIAVTHPFYYAHQHFPTGTDRISEQLVDPVGDEANLGGKSPGYVYKLKVIGGSAGSKYTITYGRQNGDDDAVVQSQLELRTVSPVGQIIATGTPMNLSPGKQQVDTVSFDHPTLTDGVDIYVCEKQENFIRPDGLIFDITTHEPHSHGTTPGIFEFDYYPTNVQMFVKDYPDGSNSDADHLTAPFLDFGKRGKKLEPFEVESIDLSNAFRDTQGNFRNAVLHKVWISTGFSNAANTPTGNPANPVENPKSLGRITAHIYIDVVTGVSTTT